VSKKKVEAKEARQRKKMKEMMDKIAYLRNYEQE
jgi:hypothetical protein